MTSLHEAFTRAATAVSHWVGQPIAFALAAVTVLLWASMGPHFGWSDTHQLIINTATTIVTFLMVFLIQHTQNRDAVAIQAKLDALIAAVDRADDKLIQVEKRSEAEVEELRPG